MPGKVVTFYSFGGAGRTMALANVAVRLAKFGMRVIAVDMDLEAPALHHFLPGVKPESEGVLEFFADWRVAIDTNAAGPPNVLGSLYTTTVEHGPGSLRVLLAGCQDAGYGLKLERLALEDFYKMDWGGSAVETLRAQLVGDADVVLVDARSGVTDLTSVASIQLPDGVVFVSLPNERCYNGSRDVARAIRKAPSTDRAGRDPPSTWLVLSRVPDRRLLRPWLEGREASFNQDVKDGVWTERHNCGLSSYYLPDVARWSFGEQIVPITQGPMHGNDVDPLAIGYDMFTAKFSNWVKPTHEVTEDVVSTEAAP